MTSFLWGGTCTCTIMNTSVSLFQYSLIKLTRIRLPARLYFCIHIQLTIVEVLTNERCRHTCKLRIRQITVITDLRLLTRRDRRPGVYDIKLTAYSRTRERIKQKIGRASCRERV